jgi:hypothetical protein
MLSKKSMDALAAMTGIAADVLAKQISDEQEVELELPEGEFLTKEAKETILDNHGKRKYDEGISKATKDAFEGKSKDDFLKEKVDAALEEAKVKPNEKVKELEASLESLRTQLTNEKNAVTELQSKMKAKETRLEAQSFIPDLPETIGLSKAEATSLFFMGAEIKEDGIYRNGTLLKDSLETPLTLEQAVKSFVTEKGWDKTAPAGRGGGSGKPTGGSSSTLPKTLEEYESAIKEKGFHPGSEEAKSLLAEAAKEAPEILG